MEQVAVLESKDTMPWPGDRLRSTERQTQRQTRRAAGAKGAGKSASSETQAETQVLPFDEGEALVDAIQNLAGPVVFVSNEIGMGLVPENSLSRQFRDDQGRLNQTIAEICARVVFVAAGQPLVMSRTALSVSRRMPACWPMASTTHVALLITAASSRDGWNAMSQFSMRA